MPKDKWHGASLQPPGPLEDPSTLLVYLCRNYYPRKALSIRTQSPGNWEEGFRHVLQRSSLCAVHGPLEIVAVQDASRSYLSSQQQHRTAFLLVQVHSMTSRNKLHHVNFQPQIFDIVFLPF